MLRKIDMSQNRKIIELLQKIREGILSMLHDYLQLYSLEEIKYLVTFDVLIKEIIPKIEILAVEKEEIERILEQEMYLKSLSFRCWNFAIETGGGYGFISWFKNDVLGNMPKVISSTFSKEIEDTFCQARYGILYEVSLEGFLGACNKDAATLVEDSSKRSIYTVGVTEEGKVINSYNLATPVITPVQIFIKNDNSYKSKHNEVILDARYIKPVSVIYTNENDLEMVFRISKIYNIPFVFKGGKSLSF